MKNFETKLRDLCGYVENGTETSVKVFQDDATKEWVVRVGRDSYYGHNMMAAFDKAFANWKDPFQ